MTNKNTNTNTNTNTKTKMISSRWRVSPGRKSKLRIFFEMLDHDLSSYNIWPPCILCPSLSKRSWWPQLIPLQLWKLLKLRGEQKLIGLHTVVQSSKMSQIFPPPNNFLAKMDHSVQLFLPFLGSNFVCLPLPRRWKALGHSFQKIYITSLGPQTLCNGP